MLRALSTWRQAWASLPTGRRSRLARQGGGWQGRCVPKPQMLAGGIVEPGGGSPGGVVAFVAVSVGLSGSRLFKVEGPADAPNIRELPGATTIDLGRMQRDVERELGPVVATIRALGGHAAITRPSPAWVCGKVRDHLKATEGLDIG